MYLIPDRATGNMEILRLDANTNARQLAEKDPHPAENFDGICEKSADNFILMKRKKSL